MHSMHFIGEQDFDTFMWLDFVLDQSRHMKQRRVGYQIWCTSCQPGLSIITVRLIMQQVWLARERSSLDITEKKNIGVPGNQVWTGPVVAYN